MAQRSSHITRSCTRHRWYKRIAAGSLPLAIGDIALAHPAEAIDVPNGMVRGGVLVDVVNGDLEVLYRRHSADWVRIVPLDEDDADNIERCTAYEISVGQSPECQQKRTS
jgi:hypothetical protein